MKKVFVSSLTALAVAMGLGIVTRAQADDYSYSSSTTTTTTTNPSSQIGQQPSEGNLAADQMRLPNQQDTILSGDTTTINKQPYAEMAGQTSTQNQALIQQQDQQQMNQQAGTTGQTTTVEEFEEQGN